MRNLRFLKKYFKDYLIAHYKQRDEGLEKPLYRDLGILNPSIGTSNLGDIIIFDSVYHVLREIYPQEMITNFPTQLHSSFDAMSLMREKELLFIAGTNLLSSNLETKHQWKIHSGHKKFLKNKVVLFGCGWWQYQDEVNSYSKDIYNTVLHKDLLHSARDQYTVDKLKNAGIENVVNTSCPTLWSITPEKSKLIPKNRGSEVVTTLTFYHKNHELDYRMLEILSLHYEKVHLWIQGMDDVQYFQEIDKGLPNVELLPPTIEAFNAILTRSDIDYIGTRLHAGIRALQNNVRTLILAVDNRALEIGKDVNLNVIKREEVEGIPEFIEGSYITDIRLPQTNINRWKATLKNNLSYSRK